jgi:hypothetical protein
LFRRSRSTTTRFSLRIQRNLWRDLAASLSLMLLLSAVAIWIAIHFVRPALPDTITYASGPEGIMLRILCRPVVTP